MPLIISGAGVAQDQTCSDLIDFTDFLPTLLDATGLSLPQSDPVDGYSFWPQCQGKAGNPRQWVYGYYDPKWGRFSKSEYAHTRKWKLYADGRFYNMENDPLEQQPLSLAQLNAGEEKIRQTLFDVIKSMQAQQQWQ